MKDGTVFMVEMHLDFTSSTVFSGSFGMYDIDDDTMLYDTDQLSDGGDGLVATDRYMFMSSWELAVDGSFTGKIMALDTWNSSAVFETMITNLSGPADMCVGPDNMVVIPSLLTGKIWFAQHSEGNLSGVEAYEPVDTYPYEGESDVCRDYMITTDGWLQNLTDGTTYSWNALRFWMDKSGYGCKVLLAIS